MRAGTIAATLLIATSVASARPKQKPTPKPKPPPAEKQEADRHFKSGVALFDEAKYSEALAEFERAYEIEPAPIVLYNIAACHRELSQYGEAVKFYRRFLSEGAGKAPPGRLAAAKSELDGVLARIARVSVTVTPGDGAALSVDGSPVGTLPIDMPLILPPGEHKVTVHLEGKRDAERTVRVASGDEVAITLSLADLPPDKPLVIERRIHDAPAEQTTRFVIGAGFGTNLSKVGDTGAPELRLGVAVGSRLELAIDALFVAYAVMPSVRVRVAGDRVALHVIAAMPVSIGTGAMSTTFIAGAAGLGVRVRATPSLALRFDSLASFAGSTHGTTFPAFIGGELWF